MRACAQTNKKVCACALTRRLTRRFVHARFRPSLRKITLIHTHRTSGQAAATDAAAARTLQAHLDASQSELAAARSAERDRAAEASSRIRALEAEVKERDARIAEAAKCGKKVRDKEGTAPGAEAENGEISSCLHVLHGHSLCMHLSGTGEGGCMKRVR